MWWTLWMACASGPAGPPEPEGVGAELRAGLGLSVAEAEGIDAHLAAHPGPIARAHARNLAAVAVSRGCREGCLAGMLAAWGDLRARGADDAVAARVVVRRLDEGLAVVDAAACPPARSGGSVPWSIRPER